MHHRLSSYAPLWRRAGRHGLCAQPHCCIVTGPRRVAGPDELMSLLAALPQPIPYQGSKRLLARQICAQVTRPVATLYEPFAGSAALTLYAAQHNLAKYFVLGEALPELAGLWRLILADPERVAQGYAARWAEPDRYGQVRDRFNRDRDPLDLHYLLVRCVKNAVRFSAKGDFSQSADRRRLGTHPDRLANAVRRAARLLRGRTEVVCGDWQATLGSAGPGDLAYLDPPWAGTSSGPDLRYGRQLQTAALVVGLRALVDRKIAFLLSYDGRTGDQGEIVSLPADLGLRHQLLDAGRSAQATLLGRSARTWESLYVFDGAHTRDEIQNKLSAARPG